MGSRQFEHPAGHAAAGTRDYLSLVTHFKTLWEQRRAYVAWRENLREENEQRELTPPKSEMISSQRAMFANLAHDELCWVLDMEGAAPDAVGYASQPEVGAARLPDGREGVVW